MQIILHKIFLTCFFSALIAQTIKVVLHLYKTRKFDWRWFLRDASWPSAHTAAVTALTLSLFWMEGVTNLSMAVGVLSVIVVRNLIGDKIFATHQETLINRIIKKIQQSLAGEAVQWKHLIGHTIKEIIAGFILGILVTVVIFLCF